MDAEELARRCMFFCTDVDSCQWRGDWGAEWGEYRLMQVDGPLTDGTWASSMMTVHLGDPSVDALGALSTFYDVPEGVGVEDALRDLGVGEGVLAECVFELTPIEERDGFGTFSNAWDASMDVLGVVARHNARYAPGWSLEDALAACPPLDDLRELRVAESWPGGGVVEALPGRESCMYRLERRGGETACVTSSVDDPGRPTPPGMANPSVRPRIAALVGADLVVDALEAPARDGHDAARAQEGPER